MRAALEAASGENGVLGTLVTEPHRGIRFFPFTYWVVRKGRAEIWADGLLPTAGCGPPLGFGRPPPAEINEQKGRVGYLTYGDGDTRTIEQDLFEIGLSTNGADPELDRLVRDEILGRAIRIAHQLFRREPDGTPIPGWSWGMTFTTEPPSDDLPRSRVWLGVVAGDHPAAGGQVIGSGMVAIYSTFLKRTMYVQRKLDPPLSAADRVLLDGTYRWGEDRTLNFRVEQDPVPARRVRERRRPHALARVRASLRLRPRHRAPDVDHERRGRRRRVVGGRGLDPVAPEQRHDDAGRRGAVSRLVLALAMLGLAAATASADEVRLKDGEILHGRVVEEKSGTLVIEATTGRRAVRIADVAERVAGEDPQAELARREAALAPDDDPGREALARFAWSRRLDADAARLRAPDDDAWPAPWAPPGRTGPRWRRARRDPAVGGALAWLAAHQEADGRLDADTFSAHCPADDACEGPGGGHHGERQPCGFDGAVTALAVMAWLADGSTPVSGPYADAVKRGVEACRRVVRGGTRGFDRIWNLALGVQALADAACAARDPALRDDVASGVQTLLAQQRADGGWSYVYAIGDVPTTGCVLMALGQAAQAGVAVDRARIERALAFLEARYVAESAKTEYHDGAEQKGYTPTTANAAAALAARAALGVLGETPDLGRRIAAATGRKPRWKLSFEEVETRDGRTVKAQVGNLYPWAWYLASSALGRRSASSAWLKGLASALRSGQVTEGHAAGSWDPLGPYSLSGGRAFTTALGALMLQEAHRYPREGR